MDNSIAVVILTYNEELHLNRCLLSIKDIASEIWVIDSGSNDATKAIAEAHSARFIEHKWPGNQAAQFNWALDNCQIASEWILRLDADEYLLSEMAKEIEETIPNIDTGINGVYLKRRVYFKGKWIRFGGFYPIKLLRLWRKGKGRYEDIAMDEHIILSTGKTITLRNDFVDENLNNIEWWINKHKRGSIPAFFTKRSFNNAWYWRQPGKKETLV